MEVGEAFPSSLRIVVRLISFLWDGYIILQSAVECCCKINFSDRSVWCIVICVFCTLCCFDLGFHSDFVLCLVCTWCMTHCLHTSDEDIQRDICHINKPQIFMAWFLREKMLRNSSSQTSNISKVSNAGDIEIQQRELSSLVADSWWQCCIKILLSMRSCLTQASVLSTWPPSEKSGQWHQELYAHPSICIFDWRSTCSILFDLFAA